MSWVHGTKRRKAAPKHGTTHKKKPGVHHTSRRGSPIPAAAKADAWKHRFQAKKQG